MMWRNKSIPVHPFFRVLFGRETGTFDLLAIFIASVSFAALTLRERWSSDVSHLDTIILTILALDIAGGAVANFTKGTNDYYAESSRKRFVFVLFHLLQPAILMWMFPDEASAIVSVALWTLASTLAVTSMKRHDNQRVLASTLLLFALFVSVLVNVHDPLIRLTLQLFAVKLILAFGVDWTRDDNRHVRP